MEPTNFHVQCMLGLAMTGDIEYDDETHDTPDARTVHKKDNESDNENSQKVKLESATLIPSSRVDTNSKSMLSSSDNHNMGLLYPKNFHEQSPKKKDEIEDVVERVVFSNYCRRSRIPEKDRRKK